MTDKDIIRFWKYVDRSYGSDSCWMWLGSHKATGYGQMCIWDGTKRKTPSTHRIAWELTNGAIPPDMLVCHSCDNPPCCNPKHLFLGTDLDNAHDRNRKGRTYHSVARETIDAIIAEYAARNQSQRSIAHKYGVHSSYVCRLVNNKHTRCIVSR